MPVPEIDALVRLTAVVVWFVVLAAVLTLGRGGDDHGPDRYMVIALIAAFAVIALTDDTDVSPVAMGYFHTAASVVGVLVGVYWLFHEIRR